MSDNLKLSLGSSNSGNGNGGASSNPTMGWAAVAFGLLGIFGPGFIFVPLALVTSVIALFMGQFIWAILGLFLTLAGFLTSPKLWLILGMGFFIHWLRSMGVPVPEGIDV